MEFLHLWYFAAILPFLLLFFLLKKLEKRKYRDIPTALIVKRIGGIKLFAKKSGRILWILGVVLIVIALARLQEISEAEKIGTEGRIMIVSVDLSISMQGTSRSKTGRPAIDVIKELSDEFVKKRTTTDLVGITAYASEAAVMCFSTSEYAQLQASIKELKPGIVGGMTAIGEGIFISILSLMDYGTLQEIKKENPNYIADLKKSIQDKDRTYALNLTKKIGRLPNRTIILFTDGKKNMGIEPEYPLWFCKMLGIKVYFGALESTGPTGLSPAEEIRQKNLLIEGVLDTGGKYYEMERAEEARNFYEDIDKLETTRLELGSFEKRKDLYFWPVLLALILISAVIVLENIFPRI